jgi:hypothetical protein
MSEWSPAEYAGRALPDPDCELPGKPPHAMLGRDMECRPCACGGYIWANRANNPAPSVAAHNATPGHQRWWQRVQLDWQGEP